MQFSPRRNVVIGTVLSSVDMTSTSPKHRLVFNSLRSFETLVGAANVMILSESLEDCARFTKSMGGFNCANIEFCSLNRFGRPSMSCIFDTFLREAKADDLVFVNSDILLFEDFLQSLDIAMSEPKYLMVGTRIDHLAAQNMSFSRDSDQVRCEAFLLGSRNGAYAIDYFAFTKKRFPVFDTEYIVGNWRWDNALLKRFYELEDVTVFDSSYSVVALHQLSTAHEEQDDRGKRVAGLYNHDLAMAYDRDFLFGSIQFADFHLYRVESESVQLFGPQIRGKVVRCVLKSRSGRSGEVAQDTIMRFQSFLHGNGALDASHLSELNLC